MPSWVPLLPYYLPINLLNKYLSNTYRVLDILLGWINEQGSDENDYSSVEFYYLLFHEAI